MSRTIILLPLIFIISFLSKGQTSAVYKYNGLSTTFNNSKALISNSRNTIWISPCKTPHHPGLGYNSLHYGHLEKSNPARIASCSIKDAVILDSLNKRSVWGGACLDKIMLNLPKVNINVNSDTDLSSQFRVILALNYTLSKPAPREPIDTFNKHEEINIKIEYIDKQSPLSGTTVIVKINRYTHVS